MKFAAPPDLNILALPDLNLLASSKNHIVDRWPDVVATPHEKDRERLVQEMLRRWNADQWDDTPMSFVTSAAVALFDPERRNRSELLELREFYYAEIEASTKHTFLDSMLSVYLGSYQPGADHTKRLAKAMTRALPRVGSAGKQLVENIPETLDPARAPAAIATKMMGMEVCWNELKEIGLRSPHAPGVMDHAHLAFVEKMRPALKGRTGLERLFAWLKPAGQQARMSGAAEAITAVIEPWLKQDPPPNDLAFITESLLGLYGDPRVDGGGAWAGAPKAHLDILMRWLTGENIRFFLDVVSAVEVSHMWEPRRKFWLGLHEQKRVDAAWVAFSGSGVELATKRLRSKGSRGALAFGRQTAGGNRAETSLLILKIGKKIIVEGSHDYKVHVFEESNKGAPKLYQLEYDCDLILRKSNSAKSHRGNWQGWVLERI
ncbi:EH signature domain-containing protein [Methylosinus sp. PW1]|uniref:EH signature domain-containing protein n=1 Tax=Methylosinus sp. PW1 TaxID=107636 RepID=UPI000565CAA3|nr:EH signature domain-containing protein [Methylosinus sp. PW1]